MILAINPNPAWDVTYEVEELEPGESHRVTSWHGRAGGKGINVARVAAAMGYDVHAVAPVGGLLAPVFAAELAASKLACTLVDVAGELRQSIAVVPRRPTAADDGNPTLFNEPGPSFSTEQWEAVVAAVAEKVTAADIATVSGSMPPGVGRAQLESLLDVLRDAGCTTLVDLHGPAVLWAAQAGVDLIKPNRGELLAATGSRDLDTGAARLLKEGAKAVVVTDGAQGMSLYEQGTKGPTVHAVLSSPVYGNPTGAGDAALAAIAGTWEKDWPERMAMACAVAAAAVLRPFAGEIKVRDVESLLPGVAVTSR